MKQYTGNNIDEIINVVALEKGIDKSLLHYNVVNKSDDEVTIEVYSDKDIINFIVDYIETFFRNLEEDVYVDVRFSESMYRVFINAENNAIVIGKNGQTLQAVTNVVRQATNAYFKKHIRIVLDVNNYKANRYEKIQSMVYHIAKEVVESKIETTLDFMPSDERRVVHHYLNGMENIETVSIGEGSERRLVIKYVESSED